VPSVQVGTMPPAFRARQALDRLLDFSSMR
jgi:hypothetical protein